MSDFLINFVSSKKKKRSHGLEVTKTLTERELSDFIAD